MHHQNQQGFTLIELVAVIVLLGILAVTALPRFINLNDDARRAAVAGVGAAFKGGVIQVQAKWLAAGSPGATQDFIFITSATGNGALSVNANGWPADMRGSSLTMNSAADCVDVWTAVMNTGAPTVNTTTDDDYQAVYVGATSSCTYTNQEDTTLNIQYFSNTGEVVINN